MATLVSRRSVVVAVGLAALFAAPPSFGQNPTISWVDLYQGGPLSGIARFLSIGGYELSNGTWQSFGKWYGTDWQEVRADFLTQVTDDFGLLWGVGTGEYGEKYRIDPSVTLGLILQAHPRSNAVLSLTATTTLWGDFTESPCIADYGDIGGEQEVNCRLAASELPPAETLQYLVTSAPSRLYVDVSYRANF